MDGELLELAEELERDDLVGWAQRVQNVLGDFVFLVGRPDMAVPLRYLEHIRSGGPRGRGTTKKNPTAAAQISQGLLLDGYKPLGFGEEGFDRYFQQFIDYYRKISTRVGKGNAQSRTRYLPDYRFWVPPSGPSYSSILAAMDRVAAGQIPDGFGTPRTWFVRHPSSGKFLPAKMVWGLATNQTGMDFTAHQARDGLRRLGLDVPGPDQPAFDLVESPESLGNLPERFEGAERQVTRNVRERDRKARNDAEAYFRAANGGRLQCQGCGIDFGIEYGPRGEGFMHFHHRSPLAAAVGARPVHGPTDLVPICPNCHAMVHRGETMWNMEELQAVLKVTKRQT